MSVSTFPMKQEKSVLGIIAAFAAVYIFWGTTYLAISIAVETIPPFLMAGVRQTMAGVVMLAFLLARGAKLPRLIHWRSAVIIGAFMLVGGNGLVTFAEQRIPSGLAALMVATIPMWITLFEWLFFGGKRPAASVMIGLLIGFAGLSLLIDPGQIGGQGAYDMVGIVALLAASILWAIGALYSRRAPQPEETLLGVAMEMLAGGLLLLLTSVLVGEPAQVNVAAISTESVLAMVYLAVFGSIVGYTAYIWLMKNVDPAKAATNAYVNPVIAVLLGWLVVGEVVTVQMVVAASVILGAVLLINTKPKVFQRVLRPRLVPQTEGAMGD